MMTRTAGQVPWALVLVALAAVAASGQGLARAQAPRNETAASANGEALDALLSTTSRAFSTSKCVESIRIMKHTPGGPPNWSPTIKISFPPDDTFIPPGAEAWCDCLRDNEPAGGIPSDYDGVFNTCRDKVMKNSDYNAMDLCRGMSYYFGRDFLYNYRTFCSFELCEAEYREYYNYLLLYFDSLAGQMSTTCPGECMKELSAGYCSKYRLTYGGWIYLAKSGWPGYSFRKIAVDGKYVSYSQHAYQPTERTDPWLRRKVSTAKKMCDALYPTDQARCCTYERGLATLSQCCYEKNGKLEFDCGKAYGGDRLRYNCGKVGNDVRYDHYDATPLHDSCNVMIDYYVAHPTYQQATLAELPDGQTSVVFPEAFIDDFCSSQQFNNLSLYESQFPNNETPGTREYCCNKLNALFGKFVENCQPGAGNHPSLGATRLPPGVAGPQPTPAPSPASCDACSYVDEKGDCKSVCKDSQECTVRKGKAICVQCDFFRQNFPDGKNRQCCELRSGATGPLCKTSVNNKSKCLTNEGPWTNNKGVARNPQPYTIDAVENVCNARNNLWVNRKMCKVTTKANGQMKCKYIHKRKRRSILAAR